MLVAWAGIGDAWAESRSGSRAGTLSKTTSAVREHTDSHSRSGPGAPPSGHAPESPRTEYIYYDPHPSWYRSCLTCVPAVGGPYYAGHMEARHGPVPPTRLALSVGLQSVEGSEGAARIDLQLAKGSLGISASMSRYFERGAAMDGSGVVLMDVWAVTAAGRIVHAGESELWIHGGLGGTGSNEFESLMGPVIGSAIVHPLSRSIRLRGDLRYFVLEQATRASEASAGIGVSFLSVGYRAFRFHVGPMLHGPELALTLRF
jgi:hypothetical protein